MSFSQFDASDEPTPIDEFSGVSRLFPLPNVVLFPGVLLPLHIFEPRYRQMVADALASDRLITMVLLQPGHTAEYEAAPPIFNVGCIGRILHSEPLHDGRSNIVLKGLHRVRIDRESVADRMYRQAYVTILHDRDGDASDMPIAQSVQMVLGTMTEILTIVGRQADAEKLSAATQLPPGQLCDLACHCLSFDVQAKQSLLAELSVARRVETLLSWMRVLLQSLQQRAASDGHPPSFSMN